jgi:hypothetical protein
MKRCVRGSAAALRSASITAASSTARVLSAKRARMVGSTHASSGMSGKAWTLPTPSRAVVDLSEMAPRSSNSKPRRGELSRTCHSLPPELRLRPWNESRTNRARIADSFLSEFVHGDIWWHRPCLPQNRVKCRQTAATHDRHRSPVVAPAAKNRGLGASGHGRASRIIASSPSPCSVAAST